MTTQEQGPQCPPVPDELLNKWLLRVDTSIQDDLRTSAEWGYAQALAAAQRLAAEERQRGADEELEACCAILSGEFNYHHLAEPLRAARRPKPPTLRERAIKALRERLCGENEPMLHPYIYGAMNLALQALETGDER